MNPRRTALLGVPVGTGSQPVTVLLQPRGLRSQPPSPQPMIILLDPKSVLTLDNFKGLSLTCVEAKFRNPILGGKLSTRSIRSTCVLWKKITEFENENIKLNTVIVPPHLSDLKNSATFRHEF